MFSKKNLTQLKHDPTNIPGVEGEAFNPLELFVTFQKIRAKNSTNSIELCRFGALKMHLNICIKNKNFIAITVRKQEKYNFNFSLNLLSIF